MALSQVQCLDDNHVNWRLTESKPEFFFSEEQRLALESLLSTGIETFSEVIKKENIRQFLSEVEIQRLLQIAENYIPGSEKVKRDNDQSEVASLEYWPSRSDISIPSLDLGWPDSAAYRGVTRANVYTQPPMEGQTHIKEVVRKMISQAQKVIAVVMDIFTDVDIFKDMLDMSFKKKVPVYIILDEDHVEHFLQMCERAAMHVGHLKNLRVRSMGGTEFYTRTSIKVRGALGEKFMFVDGDKAVSGSYSFTWAASRIDRNIITVLTGQVVDTFDKQFQLLYLLSKEVNLKNLKLKNEPEPEPLPQANIPAPLPSAQMAKKLINPKYALVKTNNESGNSSDKQSETKMENSQNKNAKVDKSKVIEQAEVKEEISPVLAMLRSLEKVSMFDYLPTWPEPEPDNSVIGFINIREATGSTRIQICEGLQTKNVDTYVPTQKTLNEMKKAALINDNIPSSAEAIRQTENGPSVEDVVSASYVQVTSHESATSQPMQKVTVNDHPNSTEKLQTAKKTTDQETKPPIPKPRTVSATNIVTLRSKNRAENNTVNATNGPTSAECNVMKNNTLDDVDASGVSAENKTNLVKQTGLRQAYEHVNSQQSISDASSTSTSDDYWESNNQRRNSDLMLNGIADKLRLHREELRDSRDILLNSRKRFSRSLTDLTDDYNLENVVIERPQKVLEFKQKYMSQEPLYTQRKHHYPAENTETKQSIPYEFRTPATAFRSNRDKQHLYFNTLTRNQDLSKPRKEVTDKPVLYHRTDKKASPVANDKMEWTSKMFPNTRSKPINPLFRSNSALPLHNKPRSGKTVSTVNPGSESQKPESFKTPFGISYSKLSQSRHLKNKLASYSSVLGSKTNPDSGSHRGGSQ
ncbi:protein FAM83G [Protopterus annectens]|uniref:protein FAM83G n=1 Tax=Protopterus annectens TaxID=7888 RepID=UPI001CFA8A18|nr:protein FAM83G [Protopterus annectens]